jgi:GNAT superfamily N-acetyltransferase
MNRRNENDFVIKSATINDVSLIFDFIKELAEYEKLSHAVTATENILKETLFGKNANAEVIIGYYKSSPIGYALFFHNFSTFTGRPGIYLEDLYVKPEMRGNGFGKKLLVYIAKLAQKRNCSRLEWCVLDWNKTAIDFYKSIGAKAMDEWTIYRVDAETLMNLAEK